MTAPRNYKQITTTTYNDVAAAYAARDRAIVDESPDVQEAIDTFALHLPPGARILDIGCGAGRDTRTFRARGFKVTGIDIAEQMIAQARRADPRGTYVVMDAEALTFDAGSFDAVWANASLHHVPKHKLHGILKKLRTILTPGGLIFIKVKRGYGDLLRTNRNFDRDVVRYFTYFTVGELTELLVAERYTIIGARTTTKREWVDVLARAL